MKLNSQWAGMAVICAGLFSLTSTLPAQNANVVVKDAWVRLPAPAQNDTALYFAIQNHGSEPRAIVSASSGAADKVEMHEEKIDKAKKMMSMTPVSQIAIPAKGKTDLKPGGFHMMLFGLKSKLAVGATVPVTITLDDGSTVAVMARVRDSADSMSGMNMKK